MNSGRNLIRSIPAIVTVMACLAPCPSLSQETKTIARMTYDDAVGGVLRVDRMSPAGRGAADAQQSLNHLDRGTVKVAWRQTMEQYAQGATQPNLETLYTVRFLNSNGQLFFHLGFLGSKAGPPGGPITATAATGELGRWKPGVELRFEVAMNLDANTCSIAIDGKECARDIPVNRPGALNYVQFRDGTGLGLQDGKFKLTLDDIAITSQVEPQKLLERYRNTPPVDNPVPKFNPKAAETPNCRAFGLRNSWDGAGV
jgi:hypothetical protein